MEPTLPVALTINQATGVVSDAYVNTHAPWDDLVALAEPYVLKACNDWHTQYPGYKPVCSTTDVEIRIAEPEPDFEYGSSNEVELPRTLRRGAADHHRGRLVPLAVGWRPPIRPLVQSHDRGNIREPVPHHSPDHSDSHGRQHWRLEDGGRDALGGERRHRRNLPNTLHTTGTRQGDAALRWPDGRSTCPAVAHFTSLPDGLSFGELNGTIWGTPESTMPMTPYTIQVISGTSTDTATLMISVIDTEGDRDLDG